MLGLLNDLINPATTRLTQRRNHGAQFNPSNVRQSCATGGAPPTRQYAGERRRRDQRQCRRRSDHRAPHPGVRL
jgi:hypothetical protein